MIKVGYYRIKKFSLYNSNSKSKGRTVKVFHNGSFLDSLKATRNLDAKEKKVTRSPIWGFLQLLFLWVRL